MKRYKWTIKKHNQSHLSFVSETIFRAEYDMTSGVLVDTHHWCFYIYVVYIYINECIVVSHNRKFCRPNLPIRYEMTKTHAHTMIHIECLYIFMSHRYKTYWNSWFCFAGFIYIWDDMAKAAKGEARYWKICLCMYINFRCNIFYDFIAVW